MNSITIYDKIAETSLGTFACSHTYSYADNLNEAPSGIKLKMYNGQRAPYDVNSIVYHDDTASWFVIKSDKTEAKLSGGTVVYDHELQLSEMFEWFNYKHLPTCAFSANRYTIDEMFDRLFHIAGLTITLEYPTFIDETQLNKFFSFENFTVASAVKAIAKSLNAIPKLRFNSGTKILYFVSRNGNDSTILNGLDTQFPALFEQSESTDEQFLTRTITNASNVKSKTLVYAPKSGGFRNVSDSATYDADSSYVQLPSKISDIEQINLLPKIQIQLFYSGTMTSTVLYTGYYLVPEQLRAIIKSFSGSFTILSSGDIDAMTMPTVNTLFGFNKSDNYGDTPYGFFGGLYTIRTELEYKATQSDDGQDRIAYFTIGNEKMYLPSLIRDGVGHSGASEINVEDYELIKETSGEFYEAIYIVPQYASSGFFNSKLPMTELLIQVGYYPTSDIKVSYDNDDDAQDERFYNQSGKLIDSTSLTKLITSYVNESANYTITRQAKYTAFSSILPLGQVIKDNNIFYVITQRSIDMAKGHYSVIYGLSINRIARSENITADNTITTYSVPQDDFVYREHLYKDYIEFGLDSSEIHNETPYMPLTKLLTFGIDSTYGESGTYAGALFDFTCLVKSAWGLGIGEQAYYVLSPSIFDLTKSKYMKVAHDSNYIIGLRQEAASGDVIAQTPIRYCDSYAETGEMRFVFLDETELMGAVDFYNGDYGEDDPIVPFTDLTNVNDEFFDVAVLAAVWDDGGTPTAKDTYYSMDIRDTSYDKDGLEIPCVGYQVQLNDNADRYGRIVVADDFFAFFNNPDGLIEYTYVGSTTRFTNENANQLFSVGYLSTKKADIIYSSMPSNGFVITLWLYYSGSWIHNPATLLNTNIGFYAYYKDESDVVHSKFLFAINDFTLPSITYTFKLLVNNWKI